jgi:hypothetical protein
MGLVADDSRFCAFALLLVVVIVSALHTLRHSLLVDCFRPGNKYYDAAES